MQFDFQTIFPLNILNTSFALKIATIVLQLKHEK